MGARSEACRLPLSPQGLYQWQLLVLAVTLGCIAVQAAAGGASVNVSSSRELLAALQSQQVDRIVLQNDVAMGPEFDQLKRAPLQITRCAYAHAEALQGSSGSFCAFACCHATACCHAEDHAADNVTTRQCLLALTLHSAGSGVALLTAWPAKFMTCPCYPVPCDYHAPQGAGQADVPDVPALL